MTKTISIVCPSLVGGGAEKVAVNLANQYVLFGYNVDILLFNAEGPYKKLINQKVNIVDLQLKHYRNPLVATYLFPVRKYLKTAQPDFVLSVIRSSNIIVGLAAKGLNIKSRLFFREANTMEGVYAAGFLKKHIYLAAMRKAYKKAEKIIANSHDTLSDIIKAKIIPEGKGVVIPNPVLPNNYADLGNQLIFDPFWPQTESKVILGVGRLHPQKNFLLLIKAFKLVHEANQNTKLVIIGEGDEKSKLRRLTENLKLNKHVIFLSFKQNIFPYIKSADVFVLSSNYEGFGNVLVEALAMGTPVVSVDCPGGPRMILKDGMFGRLVKPGDKLALAKAIKETLNGTGNPDAGHEVVKTYTVDFIAKEYMGVIDSEY